MRSFRNKPSKRRQTYLKLISEIERQLRDAYHEEFTAGQATQASLAEKLEVHRSVVNRRLTGRANMTLETLADMVWALNRCIDVSIYDPSTVKSAENHHFDPTEHVNATSATFTGAGPNALGIQPTSTMGAEVARQFIQAATVPTAPVPSSFR